MDYADKVSKLLRKAERAATEAEAEAFFTKAQNLMIKHAISEAELGLDKENDVIVEKQMRISGTHRAPIFQMGSRVASINGLKVLVSKLERRSKRDAELYGGEARPHTIVLHLIGFESDVTGVMALIQSLELQALREMRRWWKAEGGDLYGGDWVNNHDKNKAKHTFVGGFGDKVAARLAEAKKAATQEVAEERFAARADTSTDTLKDMSDSVSLVLRSRKERVDEWYDKKYGGLTRRSRTGSYRRGGIAASAAGAAAGARADIGQTRMGGSRKGISGG